MSRLLRVTAREQCIGCYSCMYACSRSWHNIITVEKAAMRVKNYAGVEGAFSVRPCYGCHNPDCAIVCPTEALVKRKGGGVNLDADKCIHCLKCVKACIANALQWDHEKKIPIVCHHCGICVKFCPNAVISMVEVKHGEQ